MTDYEWALSPRRCDWFWGSHACDLAKGHSGVHIYGDESGPDACSRYDEANKTVQWATFCECQYYYRNCDYHTGWTEPEECLYGGKVTSLFGGKP